MSTDIRTMFDGRFVGAWDLVGRDDKPRDFTLEIESVAPEALAKKPGSKETAKRPIVRFVKTVKALVLNKTNKATIVDLYGNDTRKWIGQRVTLYPSTTLFGRKTVDCVRVRPMVPQSPAEAVESKPVDEAMRAKQHEGEQSAAEEHA